MTYEFATSVGAYHYQMQEKFHSETRIFALLCLESTPYNRAHLTQKEIANRLNLDKTTVIRCIKSLREQSLIKLVKQSVYMLNPYLVLRGRQYVAYQDWDNLKGINND